MTKTLQQLITNSSDRAEIDNLTDAEWTVWINDGLLRLRDLLIATNQGYFESSHTFTTVVDQEEYALPSDFLRLLAAEIQDDQGYWYNLEPYRHGDRNVLRNMDAAYSLKRMPRKYGIRGTNISLLPEPQEAGRTVRLRYVPVPTLLSALADTITGIEEYFSEYIEIWAVLQAKMRLQEDTLATERMLTRARDRVTSSAQHRDSNEPRVLGSMVPSRRYTRSFRGW